MVADLVSPKVSRDLAKLPAAQRRAIADTVTLVTRVLLRLPAGQIDRLEGQLREALPLEGGPETASEDTLEELELRNQLRAFAMWKRVEERCLPGPRLQRQLGVTRQRLQQLRAERKLLGLRLPLRRELYYPTWQFGADGAPVPAMPRLLAAAEEARLSALDLDAFMTSERAGDGVPPAALLRQQSLDQVLGLVRATSSHGA